MTTGFSETGHRYQLIVRGERAIIDGARADFRGVPNDC
jgi:hypothetical protein